MSQSVPYCCQYSPCGLVSDKQQEYALTRNFDPERDHFKESQSVKEVVEYDDEELTLPILDELNKIHKMGNISSQKGIWLDVQGSLPNYESKRVGQHFWAVLIGNNKYNDMRELHGCINDTELIRGYLLDSIGVPDDRIRLLHDASREAIIGALYDVRDDTNIQIGDNILVHFSGHGSIYDAESFFGAGVSSAGSESIGAICPSDRSGEIPDISYRELNHILSEVQEAKGGNITFIADCCYSGAVAGANFIFNELSMVIIRLSMLGAAERHPRRKSSTLASSENWKEGNESSFVQLAACQDVQGAKEVTQNGRKYGAFTWALVKALESASPGSTYADIIRKIGPLKGDQVPTVVGVRKGSRLWFQ